MAAEAQKTDIFPWETPGATGPFWDSYDDNAGHLGRQFLDVFGADAIASMPLDASLPQAGKNAQLLSLSRERIEAKPRPAHPETLGRAEWTTWRNEENLLAALENLAPDHAAAEARYRRLQAAWAARAAAGTDPELRLPEDIGAQSNLAYTFTQSGRWVEGEEMARGLPEALRRHPMLGPGPSPQELGARRMQMECVGRQGRFDEALKLNDEGYDVIREMAKGRFAKYEQEEIEAMDEVRANLEKWKGATQTATAGA